MVYNLVWFHQLNLKEQLLVIYAVNRIPFVRQASRSPFLRRPNIGMRKGKHDVCVWLINNYCLPTNYHGSLHIVQNEIMNFSMWPMWPMCRASTKNQKLDLFVHMRFDCEIIVMCLCVILSQVTCSTCHRNPLTDWIWSFSHIYIKISHLADQHTIRSGQVMNDH